jgi:polyribonucleotide nucleotidyltransferase
MKTIDENDKSDTKPKLKLTKVHIKQINTVIGARKKAYDISHALKLKIKEDQAKSVELENEWQIKVKEAYNMCQTIADELHVDFYDVYNYANPKGRNK